MLADLVTKSLDFLSSWGPVKFSLEYKKGAGQKVLSFGSPHKNRGMKIEESHESKYSILEVKIPRIVLNMALWTLSRTNDILGLTISSNELQMLHQFLCCMLFRCFLQRDGEKKV